MFYVTPDWSKLLDGQVIFKKIPPIYSIKRRPCLNAADRSNENNITNKHRSSE